MSIREKGIMGELIKYCNKRGLFEFTWTNIGVCMHPYILNDITKTPNSYLVADLYDVEQHKIIAEYAWININKTLLDLDPQPGDIIQANYYAEKYRLGKEYHALNTVRRPANLYRIKWPTNAHIIGHEEITSPLNKPVIDLQTGQEYPSFYMYCENTPFCRTKEDFELLLIQLVDSINYIPIWLNLGTVKYKRIQHIKPVHQPRPGVKLPADWKRYKKVCKLREWNLYHHGNIRPNVMFSDIFYTTTKEQRKILLRTEYPIFISTPPTPLY